MESETEASVSASNFQRDSAYPLESLQCLPRMRILGPVDIRQAPARRTQVWCFKANTLHSATINEEDGNGR